MRDLAKPRIKRVLAEDGEPAADYAPEAEFEFS
jgi:hypothetical protein